MYTEIGLLYLHIVHYEKFYSYIADSLASLNYCFIAQYKKALMLFHVWIQTKKGHIHLETVYWLYHTSFNLYASCSDISVSVKPSVSWKRLQSIWTEIRAITGKLLKPLHIKGPAVHPPEDWISLLGPNESHTWRENIVYPQYGIAQCNGS